MSLLYSIKKFFLNRKYNSNEKKKLPMYKLNLLELDKKYHKIDEYEYEIQANKVLCENSHKKEMLLNEIEIKKKYDKISETEYFKEKNDILKKPWVNINTNYDEVSNPDNLEMSVDYNKTFIEVMKRKGYVGTDEEIVEQWLKIFLISNFDEEL